MFFYGFNPSLFKNALLNGSLYIKLKMNISFRAYLELRWEIELLKSNRAFWQKLHFSKSAFRSFLE
jgi:hypothetical protein